MSLGPTLKLRRYLENEQVCGMLTLTHEFSNSRFYVDIPLGRIVCVDSERLRKLCDEKFLQEIEDTTYAFELANVKVVKHVHNGGIEYYVEFASRVVSTNLCGKTSVPWELCKDVFKRILNITIMYNATKDKLYNDRQELITVESKRHGDEMRSIHNGFKYRLMDILDECDPIEKN